MAKTPSLSLIKKERGEDVMLHYLTLWLLDRNNFAGGKMTESELKITAQTIYEDFYFLTMADLKLLAKRLRQRKFIRVSGNEIYNEFEKYFNDRCLESQKGSQKESDLNKNNFAQVLTDNELKRLYKDVKDGEALTSPVKNDRGIKKEIQKDKAAWKEYVKSEMIRKEKEHSEKIKK